MALIRALAASVGLVPKQCKAVRVGRDGVSHRCVEDEHYLALMTVHRHHQDGGLPDIVWGWDELTPNPYVQP